MPPHPARPAYFLDFDGCLVAIAPRPEAVIVPRALVGILARLQVRAQGALALVSGRPLADLRGFLPGLDVAMIGSHGAERGRGSGPIARLAVDRAILAHAQHRVRALAESAPGFVLEPKPVAVGLHYRADPGLAPRAAREMARIASEAPGFHVHYAKQLIELRPDGVDKGGAVARLLRAAPFRGRVPVVFGDDLTDEPAFALANARGGVSVKVGPGASAARHRLADPATLRRLLAVWAGAGPDR